MQPRHHGVAPQDKSLACSSKTWALNNLAGDFVSGQHRGCRRRHSDHIPLGGVLLSRNSAEHHARGLRTINVHFGGNGTRGCGRAGFALEGPQIGSQAAIEHYGVLRAPKSKCCDRHFGTTRQMIGMQRQDPDVTLRH
jgi:hypothetical protein